MKSIGPLVRVKSAKPLDDFKMLLEFEDGTKKEINLKPFLSGPIFKDVLENSEYFRQVSIKGGTISWPNGADIDPDVLYYELKPAWLEEPKQV